MKAFPDRSNKIKSFPDCYPVGLSLVEIDKKAVIILQVSLSFPLTQTGPCEKQGLIIPSTESNTSYPQPYFPCYVWAFTQLNTHTHTHFSWVKILTPKQWVLQKLQSNCISWNISRATLQSRLRSKTCTFHTVDPQLLLCSGASRWQSSGQNCFWSKIFRIFSLCITSYLSARVLGRSCQGWLKGDVEPLSILRVTFLNLWRLLICQI